MRCCYCFFILVLFFACNAPKKKQEQSKVSSANVLAPQLNMVQASRLLALPLHCVDTEYPNKLNQVLGEAQDLQSPKELHPAFYGCFDWHSSVHGHWTLVALLKKFPNVKNATQARVKLHSSLSKEHILKEVAYFKGKYNASYERTYGWAWLLKLAEELHTWDDVLARDLEKNLQPLTDLIVQKYKAFLPKLKYPIRVGEHTNTAFGLTFAWDYALTVKDTDLKELLENRAKEFYASDSNCPLSWEPSGFDFLSPCLQEAAMMKRVLPIKEFEQWLAAFLPQLKDINFTLPVGEVTDRSDGKLVHLDGVNFSRAWALLTIVKDLPGYEHLKKTAFEHINYSLPNVVGDGYEGGHWLGSFAVYALKSIADD